jgi:hypothetical protein
MRATPAAWAELARFLEAERNWTDEAHPNMPAPLRWGKAHEPEARWLFMEAHQEIVCREKQFLTMPDSPLSPYIGTSPDLACYTAGELATVVEVKCPFNRETFLQKAREKLPSVDKPQAQWHIWVSGVPFLVYVLFDAHSGLYLETQWDRDEGYIEQMQEKARRFVESFIVGEPL